MVRPGTKTLLKLPGPSPRPAPARGSQLSVCCQCCSCVSGAIIGIKISDAGDEHRANQSCSAIKPFNTVFPVSDIHHASSQDRQVPRGCDVPLAVLRRIICFAAHQLRMHSVVCCGAFEHIEPVRVVARTFGSSHAVFPGIDITSSQDSHRIAPYYKFLLNGPCFRLYAWLPSLTHSYLFLLLLR